MTQGSSAQNAAARSSQLITVGSWPRSRTRQASLFGSRSARSARGASSNPAQAARCEPARQVVVQPVPVRRGRRRTWASASSRSRTGGPADVIALRDRVYVVRDVVYLHRERIARSSRLGVPLASGGSSWFGAANGHEVFEGGGSKGERRREPGVDRGTLGTWWLSRRRRSPVRPAASRRR